MFNRETWQEIMATLRSNKLRTFLTAFSVAWGIFILVILLGAGQGLRNGAEHEFQSDAVNSIWISGGTTSNAYAGFQPGRNIQLTNEDYAMIHGIDKSLPITASFDGRAVRNLRYGKETVAYLVRSCMPDHDYLENCTVTEGRFVNDLDISRYRKVCAMGAPVARALFGDSAATGKYILVDNIPFLVVGVFEDPGRQDNERIYIPVTTAQRAFNGQNRIGTIWMSTGALTIDQSDQMTNEIRNKLAKKFDFDPADPRAVNVWNNSREYVKVMGMLDGIKTFIWIIGIGTLIAGIVGISNIMMISVKERTREIGVRKAIGATPGSVIGMILLESVFLTSVAGYLGMLSGVGLVELASKYMPPSDFFRNPEIDFSVAITAMILLTLAGAFAGLIPALRAARIPPVEALRDE